MRTFTRLALMSLLVTSLAAGQTNTPQTVAPPCSSPEFKQMDFWVGEWQATWPAPQAGQPEVRGTNVIRKILSDCVVEENFSGPAFEGKSVSTFNPRNGRWQQTWVDSDGGYLDFVGGADGTNFIYTRSFVQNGKTIHQRMVFKNIKSDSFDWSWERSEDEGKTWKVVWPIHYSRKTSSAAK